MAPIKKAFVVAMLISITGCLAVGIPHTSDPSQKLTYSYQLMANGRFIPAERLIREALETFQEKNDKAGIAEAYHTYGNLYKNNWFAKSKPFKSYSEFMDIRQNGLKLSKEYFEKAAKIYEIQNDFMGTTKSYFGIGNVYAIQGNPEKACEWLDKSLAAYNLGKTKDPNVSLPILTGFKDTPEMIAAAKKEVPC